MQTIHQAYTCTQKQYSTVYYRIRHTMRRRMRRLTMEECLVVMLSIWCIFVSVSHAFVPTGSSFRHSNLCNQGRIQSSGQSLRIRDCTKKYSWGPHQFAGSTENFRDSGRANAGKHHSTDRRAGKNIKETIDQMISKQSDSRILTAGDHPPHQYPGILGNNREENDSLSHIPSKPARGTVLISPYTSNGRAEKDKSEIDELLTIRVAERSDDLRVAELRSQVFSSLFGVAVETFINCCGDIIESRRKRGAVGLVATVPRFVPKIASNKQTMSRRQRSNERIVGGAECSIHEFYGTRLGFSRPAAKLLYVTEVAVSPTFQGYGIGKRLLEGIDQFAAIRGVESIYLHVDVTNEIALKLYEKAGYRICRKDSTFLEFTTSLNLHDGATRGRNHFLLYKHLQNPTVLPDRTTDMEKTQMVR